MERREACLLNEGLHVLVVDDRRENLFAIKELIDDELPGARVLLASCAEKALAEAFEHVPDIVVADFDMPEVDGIELSKCLKRDRKTAHIPIIIITAHDTTPHTRARALEVGADDFITRPISCDELMARIKVMLRFKRTEDRLKSQNRMLKNQLREQTRNMVEKEEKFRQLTESIREVFWIASPDQREVFYISPAYEDIYGRPVESLYEAPGSWTDCIVEEDREMFYREINRKDYDGYYHSKVIEFRIRRPDGMLRWIQSRTFPIYSSAGQLIRIAGISEDVTERKQNEEKINASLHQKDILIREINHRVKNNMTIISSLLNLQADLFSDPEVVRAFSDSRNRIRSMALVHEQLHRENGLTHVNFSNYLSNLVSHLVDCYEVDDGRVRFRLEADDVMMSVNQAIPCGLIVNELVTNAVKYAFPGDRVGEICVNFSSRENIYSLSVSDNGCGLPTGFDPEGGASFGLDMVKLLICQLNGELSTKNTPGACFMIQFPRNDPDSPGEL